MLQLFFQVIRKNPVVCSEKDNKEEIFYYKFRSQKDISSMLRSYVCNDHVYAATSNDFPMSNGK